MKLLEYLNCYECKSAFLSSTCCTLTTPRIATVSSSVTPASSESMGNTAVWSHVALKIRVLQRDQMDPNGPFKVLGVIFEMFCMDEWLSTACIHLYLSDIHISISDTIYCRCLIWVAIIRVITEHSSTSSRRQDTSSKPLDGWFVPRVSFRDVMVSWKGHHISFRKCRFGMLWVGTVCICMFIPFVGNVTCLRAICSNLITPKDTLVGDSLSKMYTVSLYP